MPDEATLVALADVFDVPLQRLREAAGLPSELTSPYVPPTEASRLTRRQRRAVDELIRSMVEPSAQLSAQLRAARHGDPEVDPGLRPEPDEDD